MFGGTRWGQTVIQFDDAIPIDAIQLTRGESVARDKEAQEAARRRSTIMILGAAESTSQSAKWSR